MSRLQGGRRLRGLSNTLAGLIIIAFLLTAVLPLIIRTVSSGSQLAVQLARSVSQQLAYTMTNLNVSLNPNLTTTTVKVYDVENLAPSDEDVYLLSIADSSGVEYVVKAASCVGGSCSAGSASVSVQLVRDAAVTGDVIRLAPSGLIRVSVSGGKLLGVMTAAGGYARAMGGVATVVQYARYAAVAGAVQTNYVTLNNFTSLDDLFASGNVIVVDDPSDSSSNETLLDSGAIYTYCYSGSSSPTEGGFKRDYADDIEALYIRNMGPFMGMLILGGRGGDYSTPAINVSIYMPMYQLSAFRSDRAGVLVVNTASSDPVVCVAWYFYSGGDYYPIATCDAPTGVSTAMRTILNNHIMTVTSSSLYGSGSSSYSGSATAIESTKLGFLAIDDSNQRVIYCPPGSYQLVQSGTNLYVQVTNSNCKLYRRSGDQIRIYSIATGYSSTIQFTSYNFLSGLNETIKGTVSYNVLANLERIIDGQGSSWWGYSLDFPQYPMVMKILNTRTEKSLLTVYDGYRDNTYTGTNAFGIYYYSGWNSGEAVWYQIDEMYSEGGRIELYTFHEGETSGLRPYMVIADTDGNGLNEIVFTDEWFKAGPYFINSGIYDFSDVYWYTYPVHPVLGTLGLRYYGCYEQSTKDFLYLKFMGPYVVNGKDIAEVSVQIRYSFHDAVGADVDEVDDPKKGLWGFFVADENGSIVTSATYIYQQLQGLEDTWPPNMNFVSEAVFLPIPDKDANYYILYGFGDPYTYVYRSGFQDDVEFTIVIEWLGMWYLHR